MTLTLRHRLFLTLLPLLVLLALLGSAGVVLLYRLGDRVGAILRENYDSVIAMERLNEALERIDSSFQFALAGQLDRCLIQYANAWKEYDESLRIEQQNVTLPGEGELVDELTGWSKSYRQRGDDFYAALPTDRHKLYFSPGGLHSQFVRLKQLAHQIKHLNQDHMENASTSARALAGDSLWWFASGLAVAFALAVLSAWHTRRTILQPIQAMTLVAQAVSAGHLDQVVPDLAGDELGLLGQAFNTMTHRLRDYQQSQSARLLRAQRTSQAAIDSFPDPVLMIGTEGYVEMANPAARRLLGVVARTDSPGSATATLPWQPPEALQSALNDALQRRQNYLPEGFDRAVLLGSSGREIAFLPRILAIPDAFGGPLGAAVLLQDITRFRLLDEVKSNLVATASHELKTPLTSLRLAVHLLLEEVVGPLNAKQTELVLDARENSERLLATVNNLLDLARLEQVGRQLEFSLHTPESILHAAADAARSRAADHGVELRLLVPPGLPRIAADPVRLGNALGNLLDNALRYTNRGGQITLSASQNGDKVTLVVADNGSGIPPEHLPHVFEKFFRVPGDNRAGGTGLGLAIVHEVVTAHGGTVTCTSQPGQGTQFSLSFPSADCSSAPTTHSLP